MKTFLLAAFLSIAIGSSACSGVQKSFCLVKTMRGGDFVICGVISAKSGHSVEMNVIDVLYGVETRSVITIWDGTDFDCTGIVSMKAADMGAVGDTIIAVLPMINSVAQNTWDVAGDYRRPYSLFQTAWLEVVNDSVRGYIAGAPNAPIMKYTYSGFKSYWASHSNDCITLNVKETIADKVKLTIFDRRVTINCLSEDYFSVGLYSIDGRLLEQLPPDRQQTIDCSHLPTGVYLLKISNGPSAILTRKIILW